jgi:acyl dehydratase
MVPVNSNVRAKTKLLEAQPKAGGTQLISEVSIEIEGQDRPAMIAETVSIVFE